jgi:hypothetical protein
VAVLVLVGILAAAVGAAGLAQLWRPVDAAAFRVVVARLDLLARDLEVLAAQPPPDTGRASVHVVTGCAELASGDEPGVTLAYALSGDGRAALDRYGSVLQTTGWRPHGREHAELAVVDDYVKDFGGWRAVLSVSVALEALTVTARPAASDRVCPDRADFFGAVVAGGFRR